MPNTPVLVTRLYDAAGAAIEIIDLAPRFLQFGRMFRPSQIVRTVRPLAGSPRIRVRLRPASDYGRVRPQRTLGSNHLRFLR